MKTLRIAIALGAVLAIAIAGSASAHNASASLDCNAEGVVLHIQSSAYPTGSWFDYSIDGGAVTQVQTGLTINAYAGLPTLAHSAVVKFHSVDGRTEFNFVFNLESEPCVSPPTSSPSPSPQPSPSPTPSPSPQPTPSATPSSAPSPAPSAWGSGPAVTPTPGDIIVLPPTDSGTAPTENPDNRAFYFILFVVVAFIVLRR